MKLRAKVFVPIVIVAACVMGAATLVATRPSVDARPPDRVAPLVRVVEANPQGLRLRVSSQGTVVPRTESDLIPEISGPVVWVSENFVSGGFFEEGEALLRIDPRDYDVALERARANLERARSQYDRAKKELGRVAKLADRNAASQAQLDDATNADRVAAADVRERRASLDQARRDRQRAEVRAPFHGRVRQESVDVGQFVNRGTPVAKLYAIDFAEVRLPIPDDELEFLELPTFYRGEAADGGGPDVELGAHFAGSRHTWKGRIVRTEGEIDARSRMVHVVARIDDPYGRGGEGDAGDSRPPLAVGLFVDAEIFGREVDDVVVLPRSAMRGENQVLVVDAEDRLRYRDAEVLRTGRDTVVIRSGLNAGERVVVSTLATAIEGMLVRPFSDDEGESS